MTMDVKVHLQVLRTRANNNERAAKYLNFLCVALGWFSCFVPVVYGDSCAVKDGELLGRRANNEDACGREGSGPANTCFLT